MFSVEVRELAIYMSGGYCMCSPDCRHQLTEFHHKLANTKGNCKKFPLFINSLMNCCPINHDCHMTKPLPRIREREALAYEGYLTQLVRDRPEVCSDLVLPLGLP